MTFSLQSLFYAVNYSFWRLIWFPAASHCCLLLIGVKNRVESKPEQQSPHTHFLFPPPPWLCCYEVKLWENKNAWCIRFVSAAFCPCELFLMEFWQNNGKRWLPGGRPNLLEQRRYSMGTSDCGEHISAFTHSTGQNGKKRKKKKNNNTITQVLSLKNELEKQFLVNTKQKRLPHLQVKTTPAGIR